ncbi:extensin family protein [Loktanella sp. SALINAS62]|uniref:extensin-like domain-containing protein n=1 Tax=Loktanella sp. SALINAS62 TaxID=2706124 RepID=UPI001B8D584A|nr:extensin family protein [Loktanella sp. SALINAS62]MBS1302743.1 extensin [Loktanella sp. SALINAS62]
MRWLAVLALMAAPAVAQETSAPTQAGPPPETTPTPKIRPEGLGEMPEAGAPGYVAAENDVDVVDSGPPIPDRLAVGDAELDACLAELDALGANYEIIDPIADADDTACGVHNPVRLTSVPGAVALEPAGVMRCETALAFAGWVEQFVMPAAKHLDDRGSLDAIEQGSTYVCRRRNNSPDGKLSEHSFGNAVDVMAFRFADGDPIRVQPRERDGTMAEAFQDAVRSTACLNFTTVLGPGSDESHADHLHLDVRKRRGEFRLCQ